MNLSDLRTKNQITKQSRIKLRKIINKLLHDKNSKEFRIPVDWKSNSYAMLILILS